LGVVQAKDESCEPESQMLRHKFITCLSLAAVT
jgi:hypothetical protein